MRRPTLLLADDHVALVDGIARILREHVEIVGTVTDGATLCEAARQLHPDVIVSDIAMPTVSGMEALRRLRQQQPEVRVIMFTMHADARLAAEAFRLGAKGFVTKQESSDELVKAVQAVVNGHKYITPSLTDDVLDLMSTPAPPPGTVLTARQREVLRLIVKGLRMKQIAADLNLSPRTVEAIKYDMMRDLGVHSTAELIRLAVQEQLVTY